MILLLLSTGFDAVWSLNFQIIIMAKSVDNINLVSDQMTGNLTSIFIVSVNCYFVLSE